MKGLTIAVVEYYFQSQKLDTVSIINCSHPSKVKQKKHNKQMALPDKDTKFQQKKALFDIIFVLKGYFVYLYYTKQPF